MMRRLTISIWIFLSIIQGEGLAQELSGQEELTASGVIRKQYQTTSIPLQQIRIDGSLDESAWDEVEWAGDFIQYQPDDGQPPYHPTQFKIIHDDKYLYVAYRAFDTCPDSIVERLCRRDEFAGDWMEINIDSYHDLRSAFSFSISVSGVKGDEFVSNDGNFWDTNWNPIWDAATQIDSLGWTAEVRIPFSQLRYSNQAEPVWGIQVMRRIFRIEERSTWQHIAQNSNGWVSQFAELHGLRNLPTKKQVELAPYVSAQTETFEEVPGNPYADGSKSDVSIGLDGKLAVTRDMILDFTINPDFGQVEADPGAIRLDGYEVFFEEKRPFFMESRNLFDYQLTGSQAGGEYDSDLLFYSRRIGGSPHGFPSLSDGEYADIPSNTSIAGAAKFSGKTKNGLSIGILESITDQESALVSDGTDERKEIVEPLTSYFAGRVIQDFDKGNTILGGMLTAVNRKAGFDPLHKSAYTGAIDFQHFWADRKWNVKADIVFSHVTGSEEAILATQTGFVHLLQRTDADHLGVDPNRTSLTGTGGTVKIAKFGGTPNKNGSIYMFESGVTWRSPHVELNDIGFLLAADEINHFTWVGYHFRQPFSIFRNLKFNYNHWARWDFGGKFLFGLFNTNFNTWFKNNWHMGTGFSYNPYEISNNALRGTTALRRPPGFGLNFWFDMDNRKKVFPYANFNWGHAYPNVVNSINIGGGITYQPLDALRLSIAPNYHNGRRQQDQFVTNVPFENTTRSIVSYVQQEEFALSIRINYYITPELSIQYYGQPYIFRATYKDYGYVADPLNKDYYSRFHVYSPDEISITDGIASVDENQDDQTDYSFYLPDFNYIQFRSNLVLRWEYVAGSEMYLVWSQGILPDAYDDLDTPLMQSLFDNVFDQQPHNIFLFKISYRFLN